MREVTQRRIVRCAFVLGCLIPTLTVLGWSLAWSMPGHVKHFEGLIEEHLGTAVSIESVEHPRPGEVDLRKLTLYDPETGERLGTINQVFASWESQQLRLEIDEVQLVPETRIRLGYLVRTNIERQKSHDVMGAVIHARQVGVIDESSGSVYNVAGRIESTQDRLRAAISCQLSPSQTQPKLELTVVRDRKADPLETNLLIKTNDLDIPVAIVSPQWSERLGPQATFNGILQRRWLRDDWRLRFVGALEDVTLTTVSNSASFENVDIVLSSGGIQSASGSLHVYGGTIDSAFLKIFDDTTAPTAHPAVSMKELALSFTTREALIDLTGRYKTQDKEVLLPRRPFWLAHISGLLQQ